VIELTAAEERYILEKRKKEAEEAIINKEREIKEAARKEKIKECKEYLEMVGYEVKKKPEMYDGWGL
jgi:hypothetical protein